MSEDTVKFKVYCIEEYRKTHCLTAKETLDLFEKYDVFRFLEEPVLRWQSLENTVLDFDEYIQARA